METHQLIKETTFLPSWRLYSRIQGSILTQGIFVLSNRIGGRSTKEGPLSEIGEVVGRDHLEREPGILFSNIVIL